jgi:hypothetical protein
MPELTNLQNTKICYPANETWFIAWDDSRDNVTAYGSILPTQCMETHWIQLDYYDNEIEWAEVLLSNGIDPFPEMDEAIRAIIEE